MRTLRAIIITSVLLVCSPWAVASTEFEILSLKEKIIEIQNQGALGFRKFLPISRVLHYGAYVPHSGNQFKKGSQVILYYEPANLFTSKVEGRYEIWYTQDLVLLTSDLNVLLDQKDLVNFRANTDSPLFDVYVTNTLNVGELPTGKYFFRAVLHDKLKGASATKEFIFEVVE